MCQYPGEWGKLEPLPDQEECDRRARFYARLFGWPGPEDYPEIMRCE